MFCFVNHRYTETKRLQILQLNLFTFIIKYDVTLSTILWYNTIMDKLAYHLNKKKEPAKTEGKFLYYYPCDSSNNPDVQIGGNDYIVVEVSEQEWEALIEMDRFEYNNTHKFQRHTYGFPDVDEDTLSPKEQEKRIRKDISFTDILHEKSDKDKLVGRLSKKEQLVVKLSDKDYTQAEIAEELGVTQGYVSTTLKKANAKTDKFEIEKATPDEIVWKYWFMLLDKGEMPDFLDVQLEFVIRPLLSDLLLFINWFYSVGELVRYIMKFYLFNDDKIDEDIAKYRQSIDDKEMQHFEEYYGEQVSIIKGVYVRLYMEIERRKQAGMHSSSKVYASLIVTVDKIAKRLKTTAHDFLTTRFYTFVAEWRNKRIRQFYKAYTGKDLPEQKN